MNNDANESNNCFNRSNDILLRVTRQFDLLESSPGIPEHYEQVLSGAFSCTEWKYL